MFSPDHPTQFLLAVWRERYPDVPAVSYVLKWKLASRCALIYSLHQGKQYSGNDDEWGCLLYCQNTLIDDLIGRGASVNLVTDFFHTAFNVEEDETTFKVDEPYLGFHQFKTISEHKPRNPLRFMPPRAPNWLQAEAPVQL